MMMPHPPDGAIRRAIRACLADLTYPEVRKGTPWLKARLAEPAWSDETRQFLLARLVAWTGTLEPSLGARIRQYLGQAEPDPPRTLLARYGVLIDRQFLGTLTPAEALELLRILAQLHETDAAYYARVIARLEQALAALEEEGAHGA